MGYLFSVSVISRCNQDNIDSLEQSVIMIENNYVFNNKFVYLMIGC